MSARSGRSSRKSAAPVKTGPGFLDVVPEPVDITFKLRDCEFMEFQKTLDRSIATVYDLMYTVSKQHGGTVSPEDVSIYVKVTDDEYRPVIDFTKKISDFDGLEVFYYDFTPVSGSLLIIPNKDSK